ncbi:MAG: hypothetical protein LC114_12885 [Bryobacterales bacterium]|nr:hypothetical protein [Bryobacterales bacterium]
MAIQIPFVLDPLPVANFLTRVHASLERSRSDRLTVGEAESNGSSEIVSRLYETPWLIVFDTIHSQYREVELVQFRNQMEKAGRPVCLLVVTGPQVGQALLNKRISIQLAELNHIIDLEDARALGDHLNKFLTWHGRSRSESQWEQFYQEHTVRYLDGVAAFWVALSFWVQGQFDLVESMQEDHRSFRQQSDPDLRSALLRIAAFSTERLPLPEDYCQLRPKAGSCNRFGGPPPSRAGPYFAVPDGERYWAMIHDILGRLLINGLFYDAKSRTELGFGAATDPNHLRFLILKDVSQDSAFGEKAYKALGEDFATIIFKIDPDHGHAGFVNIWRDVLGALDTMPARPRHQPTLPSSHSDIATAPRSSTRTCMVSTFGQEQPSCSL